MKGNDDTEYVKTTETTFRIVELLQERDSARVGEIADAMDLSDSTVHRHLQTLQKYGYAVEDGGHYRLGLQFLSVGGPVRKRKREYKLAKEAVEELADKTEERVQFEVPEQGERVFLFTAVGDRAVHIHGDIGKRGALHTSAAGKAMLAAMPDSRVEDIIERKGLPRRTDNTITDPETLFAELEEIRETGIAFNREETHEGIRAVGANIALPSGELLGAISVSGPAHRLSGAKFEEELPHTVRGITQELELNVQYWE